MVLRVNIVSTANAVMTSIHCSKSGILGSLILFSARPLVSQRQSLLEESLRLIVFYRISMDFNLTSGVKCFNLLLILASN